MDGTEQSETNEISIVVGEPRMKLHVNGELQDVPPHTSLRALLQQLGLKEDRVAIELNREIVRRERWNETTLQELDRLEIVQFVGGG